MIGNGHLLTRLGGVDVLSWERLITDEGQAGSRLIRNFGDLLGPLLVERIAGPTAMRRETVADSNAPVLLTVGSIMHFAPPHAHVWGSGVNFKLASKLPAGLSTLDIRAVRGPYSARALSATGIAVPTIFGDPALLLPRYMPELVKWRHSGRGGVIVVPNLNDFPTMSAQAQRNGCTAIDPRGPLNRVLRSIAESDLVVGSSLHAVVVAESLGIPARFISSPSEGTWKYRDYLAGSGRPLERIAPDIESAIALGGQAPLDVDLDALLDVFPYDLWGISPRTSRPATFNDRRIVLDRWQHMLKTRNPDDVEPAANFVQTIFPQLIDAGESVIGIRPDNTSAAAAQHFSERFADARAYRVALAAGITDSDVAAWDAPMLTALDTGHQSHFLRQLWLRREGPHALMHSASFCNGVHVFSISLRPGGLTNSISAIDAVLFGEDGQWTQTVHVPVFEMYEKQWAIDVCVSTDRLPSSAIGGMYLRLVHRDGTIRLISVTEAPAASRTFQDFPRIAGSALWSGPADPSVPENREAGDPG